MDAEKLRQILIDLGVTDVTSIEDIMRHVRSIEFNNNAGMHLNPLDKLTVIEKIDYDNELIKIRCMNRGRWRPQVKAFVTIESVIGLSDTKPEGNYAGWVEEFEDGTYYNHGCSPGNQDFVMEGICKFKRTPDGQPILSKNYKGVLFDQLPKY